MLRNESLKAKRILGRFTFLRFMLTRMFYKKKKNTESIVLKKHECKIIFIVTSSTMR